ncbi:hypothetical protein CO054_00815 [Candidatus Shapirobacteria bacterium CG_4_9_14_0_2_um_filter_39_11]|uniref:Major facilitator superfamily (MFS) profile domain-containing protein n=1 Tax=Candidatus Shapirobacteria bacterium CG_4_9_14_0_2_um_filter_39_11 TaxID=1974478 RepID=A0A2M8ET66_9BACT|nr:MAG: hypothetical protein CO054_00815 [Candidatus Shapirobacteria bacterium CG_4_9_14_0_2_um_filter_39_11]
MKIIAFKNRNLTIIAFAFGLLFFGFNAAEQHFTAFYQTIGQVNLAFRSLAILYGAIVLGNFIGPATVRKIGIKLAFIIGFATYVALVFGIVLKIAFLIYLLSFILGIGAGVIGIARADFLRLIAPKDKRGEFTGTIESVRTFGGFLGVAGVSLFLKALDINQIFLLLGMLMLLGTSLLFFLGNLREKPALSQNEVHNFKLMVKLAQDPKLLFLIPHSVAGGFLLGLILGAIPTVIEKNFGLGWVGAITSIFHLTLILVLLPAGYLSDIKGRFGLIYSSIIANILAVTIFLNLKTLPALAFAMLLLGLGGSLGQGAFTALMLDTFEEKIKEASSVLGNLGLILGIIPSFLLPQWLSQNQLFYLVIGLSLVGMVSLRTFEKRFRLST